MLAARLKTPRKSEASAVESRLAHCFCAFATVWCPLNDAEKYMCSISHDKDLELLSSQLYDTSHKSVAVHLTSKADAPLCNGKPAFPSGNLGLNREYGVGSALR